MTEEFNIFSFSKNILKKGEGLRGKILEGAFKGLLQRLFWGPLKNLRGWGGSASTPRSPPSDRVLGAIAYCNLICKWFEAVPEDPVEGQGEG